MIVFHTYFARNTFFLFFLFLFLFSLFLRAHVCEGNSGKDQDCLAEEETPENETYSRYLMRLSLVKACSKPTLQLPSGWLPAYIGQVNRRKCIRRSQKGRGATPLAPCLLPQAAPREHVKRTKNDNENQLKRSRKAAENQPKSSRRLEYSE